jgi:hypothetical protein
MQQVHADEDIFEYDDCALCHPTGAEGEGTRYRVQYPEEPTSEQPIGGFSSDQDWAAMFAGE